MDTAWSPTSLRVSLLNQLKRVDQRDWKIKHASSTNQHVDTATQTPGAKEPALWSRRARDRLLREVQNPFPIIGRKRACSDQHVDFPQKVLGATAAASIRIALK